MNLLKKIQMKFNKSKLLQTKKHKNSPIFYIAPRREQADIDYLEYIFESKTYSNRNNKKSDRNKQFNNHL